MIIRQATEKDVMSIAEILVEDWKTAYRGIIDDDDLDSLSVEQRYQIGIKRYQKYTVAIENDEVLGYAWNETSDDEAADCEIIALYVKFAKRNHGIGRALLQDSMDYFRKIGKKSMIIWCLRENHESRKFYERMGGKKYKEGSHRWGSRDYGMVSYLYSLDEKINDSAAVRNQYSTADKLNTRISIHSKYSTNKQGFGNWITSHYRIREGMSLLELGCGTGDMWAGKQDLISQCSTFVLSDFSDGMLNRAKETLRDYNGIEYRIIDIQDIPFEDRSFDIVIANMMLYHVPDLAKGLREVSRILKEDGSFYCATYGENGIMEYICGLFSNYGIQDQTNQTFTLQNGEEKLRPFFSGITMARYEDALEVTNVEDMVDYIYSLTGMTDLRRIPKDEVRRVLENNMQNGVLHVPKEYGMFIAKE